MKKNEILIYKTKDNSIKLQVRLKNETVWLDAHLIAKLFGVKRPAIVKHISNIYESRELKEKSTCSKMEQVAADGKIRKMNLYNLDMIISIGYRVNSKRATQFRIWATNVLRKYIVKGYALNDERLKLETEKFNQLNSQIKTLRKVIDNESYTLEQSRELIALISDYAESINLLNKFDEKKIILPAKLTLKNAKPIKYTDSLNDIDRLREELNAHELFGKETNEGLKSILKSIFQTYNQEEVYPSIEEKAANLLYLIIKNHPFIDGNKRIGAFMFIRFLDLNDLLYRKDGSKLVGESTLVAIALMIAQSESEFKDVMINLVINLFTKENS